MYLTGFLHAGLFPSTSPIHPSTPPASTQSRSGQVPSNRSVSSARILSGWLISCVFRCKFLRLSLYLLFSVTRPLYPCSHGRIVLFVPFSPLPVHLLSEMAVVFMCSYSVHLCNKYCIHCIFLRHLAHHTALKTQRLLIQLCFPTPI